jgi:broad specificity phosphatase PhoE
VFFFLVKDTQDTAQHLHLEHNMEAVPPPEKRHRSETAVTATAQPPIKVLFIDHTLPTIAADGASVREVVYGPRESLLVASSHFPGAASFRAHFLKALSVPQLILPSTLMDVDATMWEMWDDAFTSFVPLTSSEQLRTSIEFQQHNALRVRLTTPGQRHHQRLATGRELPVTMSRATTFLGSSAMVRLPSRHSDTHDITNSVPRACSENSNTTSAHSTSSDRVRIFLVRHGESEGNVNPGIYKTVPDHAIPLTQNGCIMAQDAGRFLKRYLDEHDCSKAQLGHHVRLLVSPYERTRQTAENLLKTLNDKTQAKSERWVDSVKELPCLAEQDFGLCEGEGELARQKYQQELERITLQREHRGKFWSRFPHGESPFDVAVRMSGALSEIVVGCTTATSSRTNIRTFIVVSHGITIRALISAWCGKSPEWLSDSLNPPNCSVQLINDTEYCGYIYGGVERGAAVDASTIRVDSDPRRDAWEEHL